MTHPTATEALAFYRANSPHEVIVGCEEFKTLSPEEREELLFYMSVHQARALTKIGMSFDAELVEVGSEEGVKGN